MIKAVFIDYTGTIIQEGGPDVTELVKRCYANSDIESPEAMLSYWWGLVKAYEEKSYGDNFLTEDEIVDKILASCVQELHLKENLEELHRLCQRFWTYAPAFEDTGEFFKKCPVPIYIITNNGARYVEESMREKGLKPAGIICGDMARAYKPHRELFEKALELTGCRADQVVHIGDSEASDVKGALAAGIRPILLDRKGKVGKKSFPVVHSLAEVLTILG